MLPTDPSSGTTASGGGSLSRFSAGKVATAIAGTAGDALNFGTNVTVALLVLEPTLDTSTGLFSISGKEASSGTHPGYARITLPRATGWTGAAGHSPVTVSNTAQAVSATASGDWAGVNGYALIDQGGNVVTYRMLASPLYVKQGEQARVPVGALIFGVPSA